MVAREWPLGLRALCFVVLFHDTVCCASIVELLVIYMSAQSRGHSMKASSLGRKKVASLCLHFCWDKGDIRHVG